MSHGKERTEKICLNCNTELVGRYCHKCGQENTEPRESVWGIITHFVYDITHFDGKFFSTLRTLVFKPGFLTSEYMSGRRAKYLHPIRMYVFTSAFFFIVFFSMYSIKDMNVGQKAEQAIKKAPGMEDLRQAAYKNAKTKQDSLDIDQGLGFVQKYTPNSKENGRADSNLNKSGDSGRRKDRDYDEEDRSLKFRTTREYNSRKEYDSIQLALPKEKRDGWIEKKLSYMMFERLEKYGDDGGGFIKAMIDKFMHMFPYLLFVSLPLYAVCLKLLYIRRKQFFYTDHILFLIHLYIFTFLLMLVFFGLQAMADGFGWTWLAWPQGILMLAGVYYAYKSMRNFYKQGRFKTLSKFVLLNFFAIIVLTFLFVLFAGISLFQV